MSQIKILVVPVGEEPRVVEVTSASWRSWYRLVHPTTNTFQVLRLTDRLDLLCDEEGLYKLDELKPNLRVPANGGGVHQIVGTVIIARRFRSEYVSLDDDDIAVLKKTCEALRV